MEKSRQGTKTLPSFLLPNGASRDRTGDLWLAKQVRETGCNGKMGLYLGFSGRASFRLWSLMTENCPFMTQLRHNFLIGWPALRNYSSRSTVSAQLCPGQEWLTKVYQTATRAPSTKISADAVTG